MTPHGSLPDIRAAAEGYRLLAGCFRYPQVDRLRAHLTAGLAAAALREVAACLLSRVDEALEGEYNRIFAQDVAASPYESAYLAGDRGLRLGQLAALYEAFGVQTGGEERERADHIGTELEFAALLCLKEDLFREAGEAEALAATQQARRVFLTEHLGRWVQSFADRLAMASRHPFYRALGADAAEWVRRDLVEQGWQPAETETADRSPGLPPPGRGSGSQPPERSD